MRPGSGRSKRPSRPMLRSTPRRREAALRGARLAAAAGAGRRRSGAADPRPRCTRRRDGATAIRSRRAAASVGIADDRARRLVRRARSGSRSGSQREPRDAIVLAARYLRRSRATRRRPAPDRGRNQNSTRPVEGAEVQAACRSRWRNPASAGASPRSSSARRKWRSATTSAGPCGPRESAAGTSPKSCADSEPGWIAEPRITSGSGAAGSSALPKRPGARRAPRPERHHVAVRGRVVQRCVDGYACVGSSKSHVATTPARQGVAAIHASSTARSEGASLSTILEPARAATGSIRSCVALRLPFACRSTAHSSPSSPARALTHSGGKE